MKADRRLIAEYVRKDVCFSKESSALEKPSKLRVPGSIPGAPTTKSLKNNGAEHTTLGSVTKQPSAFSWLSGCKLRTNCGNGLTAAAVAAMPITGPR